jgi:hypothetical protein
MFLFAGWRDHSNDSLESFIGENLSIYQAQWLQKQCEALGQTRAQRAQLLQAIVKEWLLDQPAEAWDKLDSGDIARLAVNEFILRHHAEFLPLSPLRK